MISDQIGRLRVSNPNNSSKKPPELIFRDNNINNGHNKRSSNYIPDKESATVAQFKLNWVRKTWISQTETKEKSNKIIEEMYDKIKASSSSRDVRIKEYSLWYISINFIQL